MNESNVNDPTYNYSSTRNDFMTIGSITYSTLSDYTTNGSTKITSVKKNDLTINTTYALTISTSTIHDFTATNNLTTKDSTTNSFFIRQVVPLEIVLQKMFQR